MAGETRRALLDTSVLIAHLRGRLSLSEAARDYDDVFISAVTLYEIEYGAARAGRESDFAQLQDTFGPIVLPLGAEAAEIAAGIDGDLTRVNQQIGPRDALIAGTALHFDLELLMINLDEFRRVPELTVASPS